MDVDPVEIASESNEAKEKESGLNSIIAISVALLATFMAICEVKGGNIEQAMQRLQVEKNDTWAWYQARNIRSEVLSTSARQLRTLATGQVEATRTAMLAEADKHEEQGKSQQEKMKDLQADAKKIEDQYTALNVHDDQLDLEAASLSIAISLLAMTALTKKRFLFVIALIPIGLGVLMGLAGLLGWGIELAFLSRWLS